MKSTYLLLFAFLVLLATGCKKESTTTSSDKFTASQVSEVQNTDVQDAVADKNDQDVDNLLDQVQVMNYTISGLKSALLTGTRVITVDKQDSVTFPKTITIIYTNYSDNANDESFIKNGESDVTVTASGNDKQLVTRAITFKNYTIKTDSTTIRVNGTRTVTRSARNFKFTALTSLRLTITDNIVSNLSFAVAKTGATDTLKFTRVANKIRKAFLHYTGAGNTWATVKFTNTPASDTVTWSGTVSGVNEKNVTYTKTVDATTAVTMTFYQGSPVLSSGVMVFTTGTNSYTISFKEDPAHPHFTLVTVTNNATNATHSFDRRVARKLIKWW